MKNPQSLKNKIRHTLEYGGVRMISLLVRPLSLKGVYYLGCAIGKLAHIFSGRRIQIALTNLDIAFGDTKSLQEKKRIIKTSFMRMTVSIVQVLWLHHDTEKRIHQLFPEKPRGLDIVENCFKRNKGAFLLVAHYGNWEAMGIYIGYIKMMHLYSIARRLDNPYLEKSTHAFRTCSGNSTFYRDDSPLKIVRALKNNACVAVMMDQNTAVHGVFVDFFNKKAATPRSIASLSRKLDTPILPFFPHPQKDGTYSLEIKPLLQLDKTEDKEKDILNWTGECQKVIESVVREHPENWMWIHRRWKTRPPEEKGVKIY
jgi:KDO2-lipid IV(A) lauroyltransferase